MLMTAPNLKAKESFSGFKEILHKIIIAVNYLETKHKLHLSSRQKNDLSNPHMQSGNKSFSYFRFFFSLLKKWCGNAKETSEKQ